MKEIRLRKNDVEVLAAVKTYIETMPEEMPTIPQLAKKFGINTDKLKKGFKQVYGVAPYRYLLSIRLDRAKKLLRDTELSVGEIAGMVGYEHANNFSVVFKKITGEKPGNWRNAVAE